jgi:small-conductance mechanosensitive channel
MLSDLSNQIQRSFLIYWEWFILALPRILLAVTILIIVFFLASYIHRLLKRKLSGKTHDPLFTDFIAKLSKFVFIIIGFILAMHTLGLTGVAGGLLAGAGISAFIFGFAFKDIAENFLAGIILAFNRPFSLNDTIKVQDVVGHVVTLNFRTLHIKTFDEKDVFIPNSMVVKETLTNLTRDGIIRLEFLVGIAYEDDIESAIELILKEVAQAEEILQEKKPFAVVEELAASTVNLRVFFWCATDDYKKGVLITKSNVIRRVKNVLLDQGFTLPSDIHELKLYDKRPSFPAGIITKAKDQQL